MSVPYTISPTGTYDFNVSIDVATGFDPGELLYDRMYEATIDIAIEARNLWETIAGQNLKKSRDRYIKAITFKQNSDSVSIGLDPKDPFPTMLEMGVDNAYDLRPGFLAKKTKERWDGMRYRVIPIGSDDGNLRFRTIKDDGSRKTWWHPGLTAKKFHEEVIDELSDKIIPKHIGMVIDEINRIK